LIYKETKENFQIDSLNKILVELFFFAKEFIDLK